MTDERLENEIAHGRYLKEIGAGRIWNWDTPTGKVRLKRRAGLLTSSITENMNVLEVGCGTGTDSIWLAQQGFEVTAVDISGEAIRRAGEKAAKAGVQCRFVTASALTMEIEGGPFGFAFDRGCFHTFDKKKQRRDYARRVHNLLDEGGHWLTLMGNVDDGRLDIGPPKRTALEVVTAVEPLFEILQLKQGRFDSNDVVPSKIWVVLMRKRLE